MIETRHITKAILVLLGAASAVLAAEGDAPKMEAGGVIEAVLFYTVGGTAILTALGCALSRNIVRMAVCLFGTLGAVAILYFLMDATFLGAIQLIVYAGGTLVVIVFGVMLTAQATWARYLPRPWEIVAGATVCLVLFGAIAATLAQMTPRAPADQTERVTVAALGEALLTTYLVPFELASVLLLAVMLGAAYLARRERA